MKKILLLACLLISSMAAAQNVAPSYGTITASASSCTQQSSAGCVFLPLGPGVGTAVVTLSGTFSATASFEISGDNGGTWTAVTGIPQVPGAAVSSSTGTGVWLFPAAGETILRVRCSAYVSGTIGVYMNAGQGKFAVPLKVSSDGTLAVSATAANNASVSATGAAVPASATMIGGTDGTNLLAARIGQGTMAQSMSVALASNQSNVPMNYVTGPSFSKTNISTATTTTVKGTAGILHRIILGTPVASATIKLFDVASGSCSGTPGSGADAVLTIGSSVTAFIPASIVVDATFSAGICVVTSGTTNIDVIWE